MLRTSRVQRSGFMSLIFRHVGIIAIHTTYFTRGVKGGEGEAQGGGGDGGGSLSGGLTFMCMMSFSSSTVSVDPVSSSDVVVS